ncbi:MAG: MotA/TolQ/ExbB proton channel family protein [Deltaproteobacteria bacterium]|nr:MotA/TolQ/ExbB proton channel family protein [Deltaproteobacteria bacterium]
MQIGTETGIIIIAFAVMLFVFAYFWRAFSLTQSAASIVTVIGILGTFVGIAYGLYEFNPAEIEISIPNLLAGLKIAFVTSILGIFL